MAQVGIKELLEAGVHFGHQTRRWNPKMRRFIFGERDGIYIIDLLQTEALLENARKFASDVARRGGTVLFVGTKKQARDAIQETAEAADMPYVNHRWLGGLLTNFQTISLRIKRLHDLERYETGGSASAAAHARADGGAGGPREAPREPRRRQEHAARPRRRVRDRPEDRGDRGARGAAAADPDHRAGRHQLRSGWDRLRDPGQRRRDPLVRGDHQGDRRCRVEGHGVFRAEEEPPGSSGSGARPRSARARRPRSRPVRRPRSGPVRRLRSRPGRGRRRPLQPQPGRTRRSRGRGAGGASRAPAPAADRGSEPRQPSRGPAAAEAAAAPEAPHQRPRRPPAAEEAPAAEEPRGGRGAGGRRGPPAHAPSREPGRRAEPRR